MTSEYIRLAAKNGAVICELLPVFFTSFILLHFKQNVVYVKRLNEVNTDLTIVLFGAFLKSNAKAFLYFSSVKAVKDHFNNILTEDINPSPTSAYGKSKLAAENYLSLYSNQIEKRIYILRPCMIHGGGNKGNLNLFWPTL